MTEDGADTSPVALLLDGRGGARRLHADGLRRWRPRGGPVWIRLDDHRRADRRWLETESGLGAEERELFLRRDAWPRVRIPRDGRLFLLMRVPAPGTHPHTISPLRVWVEPSRVITMAPEALEEPSELQHRLEAGRGPRSIDELLIGVMELLGSRIADSVLELWTTVTEAELRLARTRHTPVARIHRLRRRALELQRIADPLRAQLLRLRSLELSWLMRENAIEWRAVIDYFEEATRELDSIVDHVRVLEDSLSSRTSEQMNRRIYVLTLVSTILLPLSLLGTVLGINISTRAGNILGASHPGWFVGFLVLLVLIGLGTYMVLRRRGLF